MSRAVAVLELVRAPAALTVLGDAVAGAAASGAPLRGRRLLLPLASACLYTGGMALNDWADRALDAVERPERPIPSGRIGARSALVIAAGLGAIGVTVAGLAAGRRGLAVAVPLAGAIAVYDLVAKNGPAGPVAMAACRGLDVLLGAGPGADGLRAAAPAAAALAAHTAGVTGLSRGEVHGASAPAAGSALATTALAALAAAAAGLADPRATPLSRALAVASGGWYVASTAPGQLRALRDRGAGSARAATGAGIRAMVPLQAALAGRSGSSPDALALAGVGALVAGLSARRSRRGRKDAET